MINSYFRSNIVRPISSQTNMSNVPTYTPTKYTEKGNNKYRKYKLIIVLLARASHRVMKSYWNVLWQKDRKANELLGRMLVLCDKNVAYSLFLGLDRLKQKAIQNKNNEKLLKGMMALLQRMQKYKLKQSFSRLQLYSFRTNNHILNIFYEQRGFNFCRKIQVLVKRHKKNIFNSIVAYAKFVKSYTKVRVIAVIYNRFHRSIKQQVLAKLHRYSNSRKTLPKVDQEMRQLKLQLQDMTVQLQNKKDSIQRLENQLNQIKTQQINFSYRESNQKIKQATNSFKSYSLKKLALYDSNKSINNDSIDNLSLADMSIGSLLGNLNRSRNGSMSKIDPNCDCNCGFKVRYLKYKNLNESLKNQLEIVKEELQVAKDLNEHFTNEIKQYLSGESNEGDYQKLKKDYKAIVEERDQLRQKVLKYQKHIANLKSEFKIKMQELYRKVRKDM